MPLIKMENITYFFPAGKGDKDRQNPENSTKWMGIGVAVSDSPTGPLKMP